MVQWFRVFFYRMGKDFFKKMGFFQFNYNKEGKGVEKNTPQKNVFFVFFDTIRRNIWNMVKTNFFYAMASIPMMLVLAIIFTMFCYPYMEPWIAEIASSSQQIDAVEIEGTYLGVFAFLFIAEVLILIGSGPASAFLSYEFKCMTNEEHIWVKEDFSEQFFENFKNGMIVSIIDIVVLILFLNAGIFYFLAYSETQNLLYGVLFAVILMAALLYAMMHSFLYQLMATFDTKLSTIYKNAFILAVAKLPQNFCLMIIPVILTYFLFTFLAPVGAAIFMCIIWIAIARFPMEFFAVRTINNLIKPAEKVSKGQDK